MYRVYFDTNEGTDNGYGLWLDASKRDLSDIPGGPQEGMRIIIYMTGELEMEAVLAFESEQNVWIAQPVPETVKHLEN